MCLSVPAAENTLYVDNKIFQITQLREPIVSGGCLDVALGSGRGARGIAVQRIQLEVDTGKSLQDVTPAATCVDLNRAGCALMEVRPAQGESPEML
jgi:Asp-tRNA(Asn)/Glu-tRNA(Gln) amidotransferase B subunit